MPLPGSLNDDFLDYPKTVRDAVSPLPFHAGGLVTLTAGTPSDLFRVNALRRFENEDAICRGSHTLATASTTLTDSSASFLADGVEVGDEVTNTVSNTSGTITDVTATTVVSTVSFSNGNTYVINKRRAFKTARAIEVRKFFVSSDKAVYIRVDGVANSSHFDIYLPANKEYAVDNVRVVGRLSALNAVSGETPKVSWTAWGI